MRVLYVEDDEDNREITAAQLERLGHEVVVTSRAVVLLTGWGGVITADLAHARGVEGVILKPITAEKLDRVLTAAAGRVT